jgi:hypothetical protein
LQKLLGEFCRHSGATFAAAERFEVQIEKRYTYGVG